MNWRIIKHSELPPDEKTQILELKDQHWAYGIDSQRQWMKDNIDAEDVHLLGESEIDGKVKTIAYTTLSDLNVIIDNQMKNCIGIGSICVDKAFLHKGLGKALVEQANGYIIKHKKQGFLLCKDGLVGFYLKCGWEVVHYKTAYVDEKKFEHQVMSINGSCLCSKIVFEKNF